MGFFVGVYFLRNHYHESAIHPPNLISVLLNIKAMIEISYYQIEGSVIRFIYKTDAGHYGVASGENYYGLRDFVVYCGSKQLENSQNIHEYKDKLNTKS